MNPLTRIFRGKVLSETRRKVAKNLWWSVLGKVVNLLSGLFVGVLVARYLGPENFGLMNYVISYVTIFAVIAEFGLSNIELRELSKKTLPVNTILGTAFYLRLFLSAVALLIIVLTLLAYEPDRSTVYLVMLYACSIPLNSLSVIRRHFTSILQNEEVVKAEISRTVVGALVKVGLLLAHFSLPWFVAALTFDFLLVNVGLVYTYQRRVGPILNWRFEASVAVTLVKESWPLLLSAAAVVIYQRIDAVMIRKLLDPEMLGYFSAASKIAEISAFIPLEIAQTLTPLLIAARSRGADYYAIKRQQFLGVMVWISIIISLAMSLLVGPLIRILYGQTYLAAIPVLQILAWRTVFVALFSASGQLICIQHIQRAAFLRNAAGCAFCVTANYYFIPRWGIAGSAWVSVLTMLVSGYMMHLLIPSFRHLFSIQSKAVLLGWKDLFGLLRLPHPVTRD